MTTGKVSKSLWIVGWFTGLLVFNTASHWSLNADKNDLFKFLEALGRLTTPLELLLSAVVVYAILSSGGRRKSGNSEERTAKKKAALHTAYILGGVLLGILVIGVVAASWHTGSARDQQAPVNPDALDHYALLSKSNAELGTENDGLSPDTKKRMRESLALELAGGLQKQNNPIRVDVAGAGHDILVFQLPSMNDETAEELIQQFRQGDANFWNAARLMNYSQVVFSGDSYKKVVSREEFVAYGKDYDQYKEAFLKAVSGLQAGAQGEVSKADTSAQTKPFATLPTLAQLKAQMKEDNPGMSPREFKRMRAATGLSHIWDLHQDSFKPISGLYLADGTVCYQYSFVANGRRTTEYGVLTTDGLLYVNALGTTPWKQLCEGENGEEVVEAGH